MLAPLSVTGRDSGSIRQAARDILARPEFRRPGESAIDRARHWLGHQVSRALDAALSGHLTLIGAVVLLGVVALLVWLVRYAVRTVHGDPKPRLALVGAHTRPAADWLAEAGACERRGDWRGSVRARYRALVAELARRGLVDEVAGRTTGEYRAEVARSLPTAVAEFNGATDLFERDVYGNLAAGPSDSARIRELADRVLAGSR